MLQKSKITSYYNLNIFCVIINDRQIVWKCFATSEVAWSTIWGSLLPWILSDSQSIRKMLSKNLFKHFGTIQQCNWIYHTPHTKFVGIWKPPCLPVCLSTCHTSSSPLMFNGFQWNFTWTQDTMCRYAYRKVIYLDPFQAQRIQFESN